MFLQHPRSPSAPSPGPQAPLASSSGTRGTSAAPAPGSGTGWHCRVPWGPSPAAQTLHPPAERPRGVGGREAAGLALLGGITPLSSFGGWLEEFRGEGCRPRPRAPCLPSRGLFRLWESPGASRCEEGAQTFRGLGARPLKGLGARGVAVVGVPVSCGLAASTDDFPPCWALLGGAGTVRGPGAAGLPRAGAAGMHFPGPSREGTGARPLAPCPGELDRAGDRDGGGCLPKGTAGGSRILRGETAERGQGAAASPPSRLVLGNSRKEGRKNSKNVRKTALKPGS